MENWMLIVDNNRNAFEAIQQEWLKRSNLYEHDYKRIVDAHKGLRLLIMLSGEYLGNQVNTRNLSKDNNIFNSYLHIKFLKDIIKNKY